MINPYRWNQLQLEIVYGRSTLVGEMLKALPSPNGNSFGITAARRMGKTTVMRLVERDLLNGLQIYSDSGTAIVPIYIDGLTLPRPLSAQLIWGLIYKELVKHLAPDTHCSSSEMEFLDFVKKSSEIFDSLEKVPKAIVIFDEIEHIVVNDAWAGSFFANWRALLSNYPSLSGYICAVFSGAREMANLQHDIGSPLMDVLEWRTLKSLNFEDALKLMSEPANLTIEEEVCEYIHNETGGHPMILQYAMQKLLNSSNPINMENAKLVISDFESHRSRQFHEWWDKYCDTTSQLVYKALPLDHSFKNIASFANEMGGYETSKAIDILQHIGIAELDEEKTQIKRRCLMFTRWAVKYATDISTAAHDSSLAGMLESLNITYRDKYISAWRIYCQEMPNYSGAVSEMRDLVTQTLHYVAPSDAVEHQPNFKHERDQTTPTRRQRVAYLFGASGKEQGKALASEDELLEAHALQLAGLVSKSYANASALTHTSASRPLAYTAIKQAESILAQLITRHLDNGTRLTGR
ncbi:pPIWI-associating nuclease domain-containing protein [Pseudomonas parakoreensis]|uniref:pPIWI-associating nuclease domain-containing protein n=1 Tax=Pseudomonas parakoreensis TaxID=2892331 RepID=UPI003FD3E44B